MIRYISILLLLLAFSVHVFADPHKPLSCPVDAQGGKRANVQKTHIRKTAKAKKRSAAAKNVSAKSQKQAKAPKAKAEKAKPAKPAQQKSKPAKAPHPYFRPHLFGRRAQVTSYGDGRFLNVPNNANKGEVNRAKH